MPTRKSTTAAKGRTTRARKNGAATKAKTTQARKNAEAQTLVASMADYIDLFGEASRTVTLPDERSYKLTISLP